MFKAHDDGFFGCSGDSDDPPRPNNSDPSNKEDTVVEKRLEAVRKITHEIRT